MPRPLPLLGDAFDDGCRPLISFSQRLERNHDALKTPREGLRQSGLEMSYELMFLKAYLLWEHFQQQVFLRLLMGFQSNGGCETLLPNVVKPNSLVQAEALLLNGRRYCLWHDPVQVVGRSDRFFEPANSHFRHVIGANQAILSNIAAIRHHIAHAQSHARTEFDAATMSLSGRRFNGQAGRFLRTEHNGDRWLIVLIRELSDIAHQIC